MFQAKVNDGENLTLEKDGEDFLINGQLVSLDSKEITPKYFHVIKDDESITAEVVAVDFKQKIFEIKVDGQIHRVELKDKMDLLLERMGISKLEDNTLRDIKAPMPGLILEILVKPGQEINKGDQLMILEAMKMENVLKAAGEGTVKSIEVKKGQSVEKNQVLINF